LLLLLLLGAVFQQLPVDLLFGLIVMIAEQGGKMTEKLTGKMTGKLTRIHY
jgi:hypothetical protein